jgi:glycerol-3-phosphate acyltransferase PlsY
VLDEPAHAGSLAAVCRLRFSQRDVAGRHVSYGDGASRCESHVQRAERHPLDMKWKLPRYAVLAAVAYAIGTIQVPRMMQRRFGKAPVTDHFMLEWGEGRAIRFNAAGSTTVELTTSPALGAITALLDMGKAVVPVVILRRRYPGQGLEVVWAAASTIGQMLPPQHRFRGGRGEAMLTGTALALDPLSVPVSVVISQAVGIYVLRNPLLGAHAWTGVLTLYFLVRRKRAWWPGRCRSTSCAG